MKKIILIAAVAIAAAACSKTFDTNLATEKAIGFGTWAENLTKAEARVQGTNSFGVGDTFKVSGTKENSGTKTVFDNVTVEAKAGTPLVWEYSPLRFWDSNATSYTFYAVSPAAAATVGTNGTVTASNVVFSGKDNDILVATKKELTKTSTPKIGEKVDLVFNHVASLVDINVKKAHALQNATVTVSAFSLLNIKSKGSLALNATTPYNATTGVPAAEWSAEGTTASYGPSNGVESVTVSTESPLAIADDSNFVDPYGQTPAASTPIVKSLVVMPQTFAADAQKITITYKIAVTDGDTIEYTAIKDLADFDIVDDKDQNDDNVAQWAPGKHYTFYITLDANAIEFSATITPWTNADNGYHYIID